MRQYGGELIRNLDTHSRILIDKMAEECRANKTFRFRAPDNEEMLLSTIYDTHRQDNIFYPLIDQDRKGLNFIFEFDYCYCIYTNIPTHVLRINTQELSLQRSIVNGEWIFHPLDFQASWFRIGLRMEGEICEYNKEMGEGYLMLQNGQRLPFRGKSVFIPSKKVLEVGANVVFRIEQGSSGAYTTDLVII